MKFKNWILYLCIWFATVVIVLYVKGYTPERQPTYTTQEIKEIAAELTMQCILTNPSYAIRHYNPANNYDDTFRPAYVVPYKNTEHFFSANPDCCEIKNGVIKVRSKIYYQTPSGEIREGNMDSIDFSIPSFKALYYPC